MNSAERKLERTRRHLAEWTQIQAEFLGKKPYQVDRVDDPHTDRLRLVLRVREKPPETLSVVAGDAIHNARSALDHLAWALVVEAAGGRPSRDTCFPIAERERGYGDKMRKGLPSVDSGTRQAVRAFNPWQGGDRRLWLLHHLDVIDKHRLLLIVIARQRGIVVGGHQFNPPWSDDPGDAFTMPRIALRGSLVRSSFGRDDRLRSTT